MGLFDRASKVSSGPYIIPTPRLRTARAHGANTARAQASPKAGDINDEFIDIYG